MDDEKINLLEYKMVILTMVFRNIANSVRLAADELDGVFKKVTKAKVAGYSGAVVGGILCAVGFGLSFVTFGASLSLSIAGGIIGGSGGITAAGASIGNKVKAWKTIKYVKRMIEDYYKLRKETVQFLFETGKNYVAFDDVDITSRQRAFFCGDVVKISKEAGLSIIGQTVKNALNLSDDTVKAWVNVFATTSPTVARVFHIAGDVFSAALLPVDILFLILAAKDLHKQNSHEISKKFRDLANELDMSCPSVENFKEMMASLRHNTCSNNSIKLKAKII